MEDPNQSEHKKALDRNMNQICDNLEKSSKPIYTMTSNTPESVKELIQKFSELGAYTSQDVEPIEDFLHGECLLDADGNELDLVDWLTTAATTLYNDALREERGIYAYHGTNKEHALSIITNGFAVGTHFAHHLEEALELGGSWVFRLRMDEKPLNWQWVSSEHIPPEKIDRLTQFQPIVRVGTQPHLTRKVDSDEESRNLDGVPLTPPTDNPKSV